MVYLPKSLLETQGKAGILKYLESNPLPVLYKTLSYNEQNDIPVQLEAHAKHYHVFDGTENITGYTDLGTVARVFAKDMPAIKSAYVDCVCNMFKTDTSYTGDYEHCYANKEPYFFVAKYRLSEQSNTGVKKYFASLYSAGTPVVMVYELSTIAVYARDPVHIQTNDGATNISTPEGCTLEIDVARNEAKEYAATLTNAGWQSSGSEYTQTAEVKCVEGLGFVSPDSSFDGVIWANQTEDLALNAELTEALGPINTGYLTLGDGTITCKVAEKPARDIEIHFKAKR